MGEKGVRTRGRNFAVSFFIVYPFLNFMSSPWIAERRQADSDYFISLIAPANINDDDFGKFNTDLGLAMKIIKCQRNGTVEIIQQTNHRKIN